MRLRFQYIILPATAQQILWQNCRRSRRPSLVSYGGSGPEADQDGELSESSEYDSINIGSILTRALRADTVGLRSSSGIASYDEALGIPK